MARTDLGKWGVNFRMERDILLKEMADRLEISSAFLSSLEHGRKQPPQGWFDKVAKTFHLTLAEAVPFKVAIMRARRQAVVPIENEHQARLLVAFETNRDSINEAQVQKVEALLNNNNNAGTGDGAPTDT